MNLPAEPGGARFRLDWYAGATALIDISAAVGEERKGIYTLRYGSPFRPTMRGPAQELAVGDQEFRPLVDGLRQVADLPPAVARGRTALPQGKPPPGEVVDRLTMIGRNLTSFVVPKYTLGELSREDVFIEIGTDEGLVGLPWELLHDGETFLSLRNPMGRFVNLSRTSQAMSGGLPAADPGLLRVLVIAVPQPMERDGRRFEMLPGAEAEANEVVNTMARLGIAPSLLKGREATVNEVTKVLIDQSYHIIHFTGHASFSAASPRDSALVLHDGSMRAGALTSLFKGQGGCVLSFINACETAQPGQVGAVPAAPESGIDWDREYDIFGLARAFLESGSYLLGTRWLLPDKSAVTFAKTFYTALLKDGEPIGSAIRDARRACFTEDQDDVSWASYIYYGDPRIFFRRIAEPPTEPAPPVTEPPGEERRSLGAAPAPGGAIPVDSAGAPPPMDAEAGAPQPEPMAPVPEGPPAAAIEALPAAAPSTPPSRPTLDVATLRPYVDEYERIRNDMASSPARTAAMTAVIYEVGALLADREPGDAVQTLLAGSPGERIVAMALLQARPDVKHLPAIMDAIDALRTPFEQYQALSAALAMAPQLSAEQGEQLRLLLRRKLAEPRFFGTDRALIARSILAALGHALIPGDSSDNGNPAFA